MGGRNAARLGACRIRRQGVLEPVAATHPASTLPRCKDLPIGTEVFAEGGIDEFVQRLLSEHRGTVDQRPRNCGRIDALYSYPIHCFDARVMDDGTPETAACSTRHGHLWNRRCGHEPAQRCRADMRSNSSLWSGQERDPEILPPGPWGPGDPVDAPSGRRLQGASPQPDLDVLVRHLNGVQLAARDSARLKLGDGRQPFVLRPRHGVSMRTSWPARTRISTKWLEPGLPQRDPSRLRPYRGPKRDPSRLRTGPAGGWGGSGQSVRRWRR